MDTRRLSYFLRIAQDGSLTRAASVLRIAQPALSRQMRLLEEELGLKLFNRSARGVQLTDDGTLLRDAVAGPLRELELGFERVRATSRRSQSNIAIGVPAGLAASLSTPLALHLAASSPAPLRMVEGPTGSLVDWLARGVIDLAVLEELSGDGRLTERALIDVELALIGRSGDPVMVLEEPICFAEVAQLPLILSSHHLGTRTIIDAAAARTGLELNVRFHADSARLTYDLAGSGIGYGVLPMAGGEDMAGRNLCRRKITSPTLKSRIVIAARRIRTESGIVAELEQAIAHVVQGTFRP